MEAGSVADQMVDRDARAERRWRSASLAAFGVGILGGVLAAVAEVVDLPDGLVVLGLTLLACGVVAAFVAAIGAGRARGLPWHRSLWLGLRALGSAVKEFF
jgi:peptidoglycan/LPS O-acetylase OafA/YrhL